MDTIEFQDFAKADLRVGTVWEAADHPSADRLLVLQVRMENGETRQIVAGVKEQYPAGSMVGKQIVVVANLKPREVRGVASQGMLLAAKDAAGTLCLIGPDKFIEPGSKVG